MRHVINPTPDTEMHRKLVGENYQKWCCIRGELNPGERLAILSDSLPMLWPDDSNVIKIQLKMSIITFYRTICL